MEDKKKNEELDENERPKGHTGGTGHVATSSVNAPEVDAQPAPDGPEGSTGT